VKRQRRRRQTGCRRHAKGRGHEEDDNVLDAVVVGAGVSGLSAAFELRRQRPSSRIVVTEASDHIGGSVCTRREGGRTWEEGPNSFTPDDSILSLACDVGLKDEIVLADPSSYRYVWWDGQLRALPSGPLEAVFGDFLSLPGKIQAGLGIMGLRDERPREEESVKDFITRNLGHEAFERLVDPFISGVYAGDPDRLSAQSTLARVQSLESGGSSLLRGALQALPERLLRAAQMPRDPRLPQVTGQTVATFRGGNSEFASAIADNVEKSGTSINRQWKLDRIDWDSEAQEHVLDYSTTLGPRQLRSRSVILTTPAFVAAPLLKSLSVAAAQNLEEIEYPRVAVVTVEYPRSAFREPEHGKGVMKGFGQLHPRSQGVRTLGTIYSSSLFPFREPDPDKVMLVHFVGGARDPELFGGIDQLSDGELVDITHWDSVETLLKPRGGKELPNVLSVRVWPRAIPQLNLGHNARIDAVRENLASAGVKGLFLAGNYVSGVALGRCVEHGLQIGKEVGEFVEGRRESGTPS